MCTAIAWHSESPYFGRNLDLDYDFGQEVIVTPQNYNISYKYQPNSKKHYAMIGIGVVLEDYPMYSEAVNEYGLAIAGLNFAGYAEFAKMADCNSFNLTPYEIILWTLAHCKNLAEVKSSFEDLVVVGTPFKEQVPVATLHWMIADKEASMVLEATKEGVKLYDNPVGVMTNNPEFPFHITNLYNFMVVSARDPENNLAPALRLKPLCKGLGSWGLPGDDSSTSRFVRTVFYKEHSKPEATETASVVQFFHMLDGVKAIKGAIATEVGMEITRYSCCMNQENQNYYYKTYDNPNITKVALQDEDLASDKLKTYSLTKLTL